VIIVYQRSPDKKSISARESLYPYLRVRGTAVRISSMMILFVFAYEVCRPSFDKSGHYQTGGPEDGANGSTSSVALSGPETFIPCLWVTVCLAFRSVTGCRASGARARRAAIMLAARACEGLFDARLDIAFGLAANGGEFGNDKITGALKHTLLAERERLEMAQVCQVFEHIGDLENIAGAHLFSEVFEAVFPIVGGGSEIICEILEEQIAFARTDWGAKANLYGVGDGYKNQ
jgi:hypothetical protein